MALRRGFFTALFCAAVFVFADGGAAGFAAAADFPPPPAEVPLADVGGLAGINNFAARAAGGGVAALWDGEILRGEVEIFSPPPWFVNGFPDAPLVGELTAAAGAEAVRRIAKQQQAEAGWRKLRFVVFDLPAAEGDAAARRIALQKTIAAANLPQLQGARWRTFINAAALENALAAMYKNNGGGFVLSRDDSFYGEDDARLKILPYNLGEAEVLSHRPGKGELAGMLGSLEVAGETAGNFYIATGFNRAERQKPPPVGAIVQYKYKGLTETGKPANPVFLAAAPPPAKKIGGWLTTRAVMWVFLFLMFVLAALDAITHRRGGRRWNFKSAIVSTGLLGTFVGIWWGLYNFNTDDIAAGVPLLLDGLKLSFITSIAGIALSTALSIFQTVTGGEKQ